jgi:cytochrome c oxidase cbb3-type subunit 3
MRLLIIGVPLLALAMMQAGSPPSRQAAQAPSRFIPHPDNLTPGSGPPSPRALESLVDPFATNAQQARADGAKLFVAYNCVDCHGADGSGAMGPSLADGRWRFGGTAPEVFQSIYEGRPEGMPAWGRRIGDDAIWRLVAYVRSLDAGKDVSTENFTGATIERTGH